MSTSVSSVSSTSSYSNTNRITGMVSGLDVDSIVEKLMEAEKQPLYKLEQKKQLSEWKQDAYREISNDIRAFSDKYFSYTGSSTTNMLSQTAYEQFAATTSDDSVVTISAGSGASAGSHTVMVSQLATAAVYKQSGITKAVAGSSAADFSAFQNKSFILTIDGKDTTISLQGISGVSELQTAIDTAVGAGKVTVKQNSDKTLTFSKPSDSGIGTIKLSEYNGGLSALGFDTADDNLKTYLDTTDTLADIAESLDSGFTFAYSSDADKASGENGTLSFKINGISFEFSQDTTLKDMMKKINASDAGVTMKYSSSSDSLTITANDTGAGDKLSLSDTDGTFISSLGLGYTQGKDAVIYVDDQKIVRSTNSITEDGITYNLKKESAEKQTVTVSQDSETIFNNIKAFVDDYNALIENINSKISEEYDRDYQPLTDTQKEDMSDDDIASWNKKAKTGILEDDTILKNMLSNMRSALYESVSGVSTHLTEIGITTSSNYEDKGKLEIDKDKLNEAIASNPEGVMNLFSQQSESYPGTSSVVNLTSAQRAKRTSEEGLAYKLYDIIQDNISTSTGIDGNKGLLVEKAGVEDDSSQYDNSLSKQIDKYEDEIDDLNDKLDDKEDKYYDEYSTMETYINQMNSQLSSFQAMLGS